MVRKLFLVCFIIFAVKHHVKSDNTRWLPKCCPKGKQISSDGKSCVKDLMEDTEYSLTESVMNYSSSAELLPVFLDEKTVFYKLDYSTTFHCVRQEVYVIKDDLFITADDNVIVVDHLGNNWTLAKTELCADSVHMPPALGLTTDRLFVALLCPSCQRLPCIHKCCPEDQQLQVYEGGTKVDCIPSSGLSWSESFIENSSKTAFVIHGFPECRNSLYMDYPAGPMEVTPRGHLKYQRSGVMVPRSEYCGDLSEKGFALLGCRQLGRSLFKPLFYGGLFCTGALFLALTLAAHLWLPELRRTLHSRLLVAHVACLLGSFLGLAVVNLAPLPAPSVFCSAIAFFIQFSILASIFWMNSMCVDIALTFSWMRAPKPSLGMDSDAHKFLYYSLYSWGSTAAISGTTAILEYSHLVPTTSHLKPSFGVIACWFQHWESILLLVYGPMGVLLLVNIILFAYTACKIYRTQRVASTLTRYSGSKLRENKERFSLYLKLFGLMGVTWVFEIISWTVGGAESYWYVIDVINALRSIFIFVLLCLKEDAVTLIKVRLGLKKHPNLRSQQRDSATSKRSSSMSSQRTNSIQLSQIS